ncbi:MAG TPA: enolase C-terminal domain-like protein [Vicinamibacterales bacterium]|jgi:L-alanine-DL-glutamate epimerase-like enolase superfamily enzyme|nr:enolase C-terminal domain-like protein [Vicinamibacterales bacterium]
MRTPIHRVEVAAFTIPTDAPESDGTFEWNATTIVVVHVAAGGVTGLGYTYSDVSAASLVERVLAGIVVGRDVMDIEARDADMVRGVRNIGRQGLAATAISAVDIALWDAKARLLRLPLVTLLGGTRERVPIYGSGGFTSYTTERLQTQLGEWAREGIRAVKMKIGRDPEADRTRVHAARTAIGRGVELFVDANGAYDRKLALAQAEAFVEDDVSWFEEPVSSDDLVGLRLIRDRAPARVEIAAGEYGYDPQYFERMVAAGAVDVLQADATRCCGITGFLRAAAICDAACLPLSAHTAPGVHAHLCCAASRVRNLEYFYDHVRIEQVLFDGALAPVDGALAPDRSRHGLGLELKRRDAERFAA